MRALDREEHDGDHLKDRLEFPEHARRDHDALGSGHHADTRHDELACENDEHDPGGQISELDQADKRRGDKYLICKRIHELTEVGHLVAGPREVAVEPIGAGDEHEDGCCDNALPIVGEGKIHAEPFRPRREQRSDEKRHEQDARDGDDVRSRPDSPGIRCRACAHDATPPPFRIEAYRRW